MLPFEPVSFLPFHSSSRVGINLGLWCFIGFGFLSFNVFTISIAVWTGVVSTVSF